MGRFLMYLLIAVIALGVGFYFYQKNIPAASVSLADFEKGGSFADVERADLTSACVARFSKDGDKICGCMADKAATELSRYDRMMLTAVFKHKALSEGVALLKGMIAAQIPQEKLKAAEDGATTRIKEMWKTCSAPDAPN
jgi:hypothetical protein